MKYNIMKNKDIYFYFYLIAPTLYTIVFFATKMDKVALALFYVVAFICIIFDQNRLIATGDRQKPQYTSSALGIVIFPPIYAYVRARDTGMKKWRWFFAYFVLLVALVPLNLFTDTEEELKKSACKVTTSIYNDQGSDTKCLVVQDLRTVSKNHYRAKALLSNGVDMPITIEKRDDNYIYVTLAPLSGFIE